MGYVDKILVEDEIIYFRAKKAWILLIFIIIFMIFGSWISSNIDTYSLVITIVFFIFLIFRVILAFISTEFALTNRRIIGKRGFILRNTFEINLKQLESISISQPLIGRIFGFGNITIVGIGGTKEEFKAIMNPYELQKQFNSLVSKISK